MKTSVVLAAALTAMNTANAAVIPFFDGELSINYDAHSGWSFGFDKQPAQSGSPPATTTPGSGSGSTTTPATTADNGDDDEGSCDDSGSAPPANNGGSNGSSSGSGDYFSQWKQGLDNLIQKGKTWFSGLFG